MMQSKLAAGKNVLARLAAVLTAGLLMMSCSTPAYAKEDPGWNGQNGPVQEQTNGYDPDNQDQGSEGSSSGEDGGDENSGGGRESVHTEPGFTTPGNGDLGDEIKSSNGKDFYTIHTKNNNTFYLVIDHTNSTENVYMLSLIDENDLAEFLGKTQDREEKTAVPVIIPETKPQTDPAVEETSQKQEQQPATQAPLQNNLLLFIVLGLGAAGAFYYFKVYKPGQVEEEDVSEGMEGDGFPTENDEE